MADHDRVGFTTLSATQLEALIVRHALGIELRDVRKLPVTGSFHTVYLLGEKFVLRVPKDHPQAVAETRTAVLAAPVAHAAGVSTPDLVAFDDSCDLIPVPVSVFERAPGAPLRPAAHPQDGVVVWGEVGRELATLHGAVRHVEDPNGDLDQHPRATSYQGLLEHLLADGIIGPDAATWLETVLERLQPAVNDPNEYRRFVHGDVMASNVLVDGGRYRALIDWDDAGWADPVVDMRNSPLRVVDALLAGYRSVMALDGDDSAELRILWDRVIGAMARLMTQPRTNRVPGAGTPAGPLLELLATAIDGDVAITRLLRR